MYLPSWSELVDKEKRDPVEEFLFNIGNDDEARQQFAKALQHAINEELKGFRLVKHCMELMLEDIDGRINSGI